MFIWVCLLLLLIAICSSFDISIPKNDANYGPYDIVITQYDHCKGIKSRNLTRTSLAFQKNSDNLYVTQTNMTIYSNVQIDTMNMVVYKGSDELAVLWRYKVKRPCQHPLIGPVVEFYRPDRNCNIKAGKYYQTFVINEQMMNFFGHQFFYGEFTFRVTFFTKKAMLFCVIMKEKIIKKQSK